MFAGIKIGYVVKRYPRYSETFIVNEILAHETAGIEVDIFSLLPPADTHFQGDLALVRAPVCYLPFETPKAADFWKALQELDGGPPPGWMEAAKGVPVREVYQSLWLAREAQQRNILHLHAHFASSPTTVARLAARAGPLTYSFTAHAKDIFHENVENADLRQKLRDAAAVFTVSDFNAAFLRKTFGGDAARVRRVYNGLDPARFPYAAPKDRPPLVVSVGRLVEKKGFADLIEACSILAQRGRSFNCQIIGAGEQEAVLRKRIEQRQLCGWVEMLGPRPQSETIKLVQSAAVLAAPCVIGQDGNRDGLPTVLLEAMALGTPCVATDVTGIPEVLRDGDTGLMVPQHDPAALASAIERLFDERALGLRLAERARRLIEANFNIHSNVAQLRQVLTETTAGEVAATAALRQ